MNKQNTSSPRRALASGCAALALVFGLVGCSSMTERDKNTALGAGVGAVAGSVLTGGSAVGTVGGAVVGGVIGDQTGKKK